MGNRRNPDAPYWRQLHLAERSIIEYALEQVGSIRRAAQILGISTAHLIARVRDLGIETRNTSPNPRGSRRASAPAATPAPAATLDADSAAKVIPIAAAPPPSVDPGDDGDDDPIRRQDGRDGDDGYDGYDGDTEDDDLDADGDDEDDEGDDAA